MSESTIRLDKWLWFARIVKSRTLAQKMVRSGKIRVNKLKFVNPAKLIIAGDVLTIAFEQKIFVLKIVSCGTRRGPFVEARQLYEDMLPVSNTKQSVGSGNAIGSGAGAQENQKLPRPGKQDRRKLLQLKNRQYFQ